MGEIAVIIVWSDCGFEDKVTDKFLFLFLSWIVILSKKLLDEIKRMFNYFIRGGRRS